MAINLAGLLQSLGVNVGKLETQATNFLLKKAAEWARVPTRIARVSSAITIVGAAATQRNNLGIVGEMTAAQQGLTKLQQVYDAASGDVADVVDTVRSLRPGAIPPASIIPKAVKASGAVTGILQALTALENTVMSAASKVLTPDELAKLKGGVSFPSFMGGAAKQLLLYVAIGVPLYLVVTGRAGRGTRRW